jgi:hypothetical protein
MSRQKISLGHRVLMASITVVLLPVIVPLGLAVLVLYGLHRIALYALVWLLWLPSGKDVLLVYSDSPIWRDYMTTQVIPSVQDRAIILNWSERSQWPKWSLSIHVFRTFGGGRDFNPMVAVFRPFRRARVFRFWSAFKDWKRGNTEPVTRLREELLLIL